MNDKEIEVLEKRIREKDIQKQEVIERIDTIYHISAEIPKPKGLIFKRCPKCNRKLKTRVIGSDTVWCDSKYYYCACGYEYAERY